MNIQKLGKEIVDHYLDNIDYDSGSLIFWFDDNIENLIEYFPEIANMSDDELNELYNEISFRHEQNNQLMDKYWEQHNSFYYREGEYDKKAKSNFDVPSGHKEAEELAQELYELVSKMQSKNSPEDIEDYETLKKGLEYLELFISNIK